MTATEPPSDSVTCQCGHLPADHYAGHGQCMYATESQTWACDCGRWRPAIEPPFNSDVIWAAWNAGPVTVTRADGTTDTEPSRTDGVVDRPRAPRRPRTPREPEQAS